LRVLPLVEGAGRWRWARCARRAAGGAGRAPCPHPLGVGCARLRKAHRTGSQNFRLAKIPGPRKFYTLHFARDNAAGTMGPHGSMHSTSKRPSLSERCSELPRMRWPLWPPQQLQQLRVVLAPVLLPVGEQRGRPERRRVKQQRKAKVVASRFVPLVHACRSAGTHAGPRERREASVP
jgi:hypothetical protein